MAQEGLFTVTVDDGAFRAYLDQLSARLGDLSEPMAGIGAVLESRIRGRFEAETDPNGAAWKPWADETRETYPYPGTPAAARMGRAGTGHILDRYSDMLHSLSWQADDRSVTVGFGQRYAVYHEWGTRNMPRRGLLFADPDVGTLAADDERALLDVLEHWLGLA